MDPRIAAIIQPLIESALLDIEHLITDNVVVASDRSRHECIVLICRNGPKYFIKRMQDWQPLSAETLRHEAFCYNLISTDDSISSLRPLVPRFIHYIEKDHLLVIELIEDADNLLVHHTTIGACPPAIAAELGTIFGRYHKQARVPSSMPTPPIRPWILSFHKDYLQSPLSPANARLRDIIVSSAIAQPLDGLLNEWREEAMIHGDLKWENCIISCHDGGRLYIIDWEIASPGDPLWDVACLLQSYIGYWAAAVPISGDGIDESQAGILLDRIRPAVRALWTEYIGARELGAGLEQRVLHKTVRFLGARLIQTVFERGVMSSQMDASGVLMLQLASNLLTSPLNTFAVIHGNV